MTKRLINILIVACLIAILTACSGNTSSSELPVSLPFAKDDSSFSIQFIDVGQGDSALVCCDGYYMLVDGGDRNYGDRVYNTLQDGSVHKLDLLVMSHMHEDHIGGLPKALTWAMTVKKTIAPVEYYDSDDFIEIQHEVGTIDVPRKGEKYKLGSAEVEILENGTEQRSDNDSIVLLITYKKTKFLFTGDMEDRVETKLCDAFNDELPVDLLKVSHHGSQYATSIRFLRMLTDRSKKQYAVISVGSNNVYGHPSEQTLSRLDQAEWKYFRTDRDGDITVESDGKKLTITSSK